MNIMKRTKRKTYSQIGNRCKEYYEGCAICEAYRYLDIYNKFPDTFDILSEFMDASLAKRIMTEGYK